MNEDTDTRTAITRRGAGSLALGGFAAAALGAGALGTKELLDADAADAAGTGPAAVASGLVSCVLSPEMTEGPYYVEGDKVRRNITEGKPGVPLTLRLDVVDVSTCKPIRGAAVDIWHCDAGGVYSATSMQSTEGLTFLRGIQRTDRNGIATLQDDLPRLVPGPDGAHPPQGLPRREHRPHGAAVLLGHAHGRRLQAVAVQPPAESGPAQRRRTRSSGTAGARSMLKLAKSGSGYVGRITMGVSRS